ncbi:hypothetical protein AGR6A_pAt60105 [Agrobacterium sp. NCPPB 925]|nr:hypothetical protein AGR6A_pAt60105 [Agrobacterium sp. NCPPB 925]
MPSLRPAEGLRTSPSMYCDRDNPYSVKASSRLRLMLGDSTSASIAMAKISRDRLSGLRRKIVGSPWLISIDALGAHMLRTSIRHAKSWPNLALSVNVSPVQFCNPDFAAQVVAVEVDFNPNYLTLKITEGVLPSKRVGL